MIIVEIQDPEDGRTSFEVGPFDTIADAEKWKSEFCEEHEDEIDPDFVEVHEIDHKVYNPADADDMEYIRDFYG